MSSIPATNNQLERFLHFLESDPDNPELLQKVAEFYSQNNDTKMARGYLEKAHKLSPANPAIRFQLASIALAEGNTTETISLLQGLMESGVDAPGIRYNLGYALILENRYEEAKQVLEPIKDQYHEVPQASVLYIRTLHYLGELPEAIIHALAHLEKFPDDQVTCAMLSTLYLDTNDLPAAKQWAEKSLEINPDVPEALTSLGTIALSEQDETYSREMFDRALTTNPKSGRAWAGRALSEMLDQNLVAAEDNFKKAVHYMPSHIGTWHALAWCQLLQRKLDAAEKSLNTAMELDRNFGETHGGLAIVAIHRGKIDDAKILVKRALGLDPSCFSGRFAQSLIFQHGGRREAAEKIMGNIFDAPIQGDRTFKQELTRYVQKRSAKKPGE